MVTVLHIRRISVVTIDDVPGQCGGLASVVLDPDLKITQYKSQLYYSIYCNIFRNVESKNEKHTVVRNKKGLYRRVKKGNFVGMWPPRSEDAFLWEQRKNQEVGENTAHEDRSYLKKKSIDYCTIYSTKKKFKQRRNFLYNSFNAVFPKLHTMPSK